MPEAPLLFLGLTLFLAGCVIAIFLSFTTRDRWRGWLSILAAMLMGIGLSLGAWQLMVAIVLMLALTVLMLALTGLGVWWLVRWNERNFVVYSAYEILSTYELTSFTEGCSELSIAKVPDGYAVGHARTISTRGESFSKQVFKASIPRTFSTWRQADASLRDLAELQGYDVHAH